MFLILLLFASWVAGFGAYIWRDHRQWDRVYGLVAEWDVERRDLLNRLMARDFVQYAQYEAAQKYGDVLKQAMQEGRPPEDEGVGL
jgi:thiosulfate reductase cytochrome b subunit